MNRCEGSNPRHHCCELLRKQGTIYHGWCLHVDLGIWNSSKQKQKILTMAGPEFPRKDENPKDGTLTYYCVKYSRKLHENGLRVGASKICPCKSTTAYKSTSENYVLWILAKFLFFWWMCKRSKFPRLFKRKLWKLRHPEISPIFFKVSFLLLFEEAKYFSNKLLHYSHNAFFFQVKIMRPTEVLRKRNYIYCL